MKDYLKHYQKYLRKASTGLLIAPFSSQLWSTFVDSLVDFVMTLITFAFLIACIAAYPLAVPFFALSACESDRRQAKRRSEYWIRASRRDCLDWTGEDQHDHNSTVDPEQETIKWKDHVEIHSTLTKAPDTAAYQKFMGFDPATFPDKTSWRLGGHCDQAPEGWYCHRSPGHVGPCAAVQRKDLV